MIHPRAWREHSSTRDFGQDPPSTDVGTESTKRPPTTLMEHSRGINREQSNRPSLRQTYQHCQPWQGINGKLGSPHRDTFTIDASPGKAANGTLGGSHCDSTSPQRLAKRHKLAREIDEQPFAQSSCSHQLSQSLAQKHDEYYQVHR